MNYRTGETENFARMCFGGCLIAWQSSFNPTKVNQQAKMESDSLFRAQLELSITFMFCIPVNNSKPSEQGYWNFILGFVM